jgi:hypothetical protein
MSVAPMLGMMKLQLRLAHLCICGEFRDEDDIHDRYIEIQLFGGVMANLCPSCYRVLDKDEREEVHTKWAALQEEDDEDTDA